MRLILASILLLTTSPLAVAQEESGQADLSSNWAHEDGFAVSSEKRSKAQVFLDAIMPEVPPKNLAVPADQSPATGEP